MGETAKTLHGHQLWWDEVAGEKRLADLGPSGQPVAVIVGVQPSPFSVDGGHYYLGAKALFQMSRLRETGLFGPAGDGWQDDAAVAAGVGLTDLIKRPFGTGAEASPEEVRAAAADMLTALSGKSIDRVVCLFKAAADALVGGKSELGWQLASDGKTRVFRMPESSATQAQVERSMRELALWVAGRGPRAAARTLLEAVRMLHREGFGRLRVFMSQAPSGMSWRATLCLAEGAGSDTFLFYSSNSQWDYLGAKDAGWKSGGGIPDPEDEVKTVREVAELFLTLPGIERAAGSQGIYAAWFDGLLRHVGPDGIPFQLADYAYDWSNNVLWYGPDYWSADPYPGEPGGLGFV